MLAFLKDLITLMETNNIVAMNVIINGRVLQILWKVK